MPHDPRILGEAFGLEDGKHARRNAYRSCWNVMDEIGRLGDDGRTPLFERTDRIGKIHMETS